MCAALDLIVKAKMLKQTKKTLHFLEPGKKISNKRIFVSVIFNLKSVFFVKIVSFV